MRIISGRQNPAVRVFRSLATDNTSDGERVLLDVVHRRGRTSSSKVGCDDRAACSCGIEPCCVGVCSEDGVGEQQCRSVAAHVGEQSNVKTLDEHALTHLGRTGAR